MKDTKGVKRIFIRLTYLLPLITSVILWVHIFIPHLFFTYQGEAYETMSLTRLMSNAWTQCRGILSGGADAEAYEATLFSYLMTAAVIVAWASLVIHAVVSLLAAITSLRAFSNAPTSKEANVAKRVLHLICPNRVCFVICNLLPIFPAILPYLLSGAYKTYLFMDMKVFSIGPSELWLMIPLVLLCEILFLSLLPAQRDTHLDMFRLYKKK